MGFFYYSTLGKYYMIYSNLANIQTNKNNYTQQLFKDSYLYSLYCKINKYNRYLKI